MELSPELKAYEILGKIKKNVMYRFISGLGLAIGAGIAAFFTIYLQLYGLADVLFIVSTQSLLYTLSYLGHFLLISFFGLIILEVLRKGVKENYLDSLGNFIGALSTGIVTVAFNAMVALGLRDTVNSTIHLLLYPLTYFGMSINPNPYLIEFMVRFVGWGAAVSLFNTFICNPEDLYGILSGKKTIKDQWLKLDKSTLPKKILKIVFLFAFFPPLMEGYKQFFAETIPTIVEAIKTLFEGKIGV